ncbi:MAG: 6-phosphogluconolactonase [Tannerella sp.]|jgi:6-phosphogluconolactonase|nr:6-phosphogluconolactonase [Tannerella sp.]
MEIKVYKTPEETCRQLAALLSEMVLKRQQVIDSDLPDLQNRKINVALSGGSTPKLLFRIMAEEYRDTDWSKVHFFWVDERMVPWKDAESNFGEFYRTLVSAGVVPETSLFPIRFDEDETFALSETDAAIRANVPFTGGFPRFDLIILGIGEDGHTASIFPDNLKSFNSPEIVEIAVHPQTKQHRITLTGRTINHAENIIFLCTGAGKKSILNEVINKKNQLLPATHVSPLNGNLTFYLDEEAF